jgi:ligand-binding sensor domain-containing protein
VLTGDIHTDPAATLHRGLDGVLRVGTPKGVYVVSAVPNQPWTFASEGIVNSVIRAIVVGSDGASWPVRALQYNGLASVRSTEGSPWATSDLRILSFQSTTGMVRDSAGRLIAGVWGKGLSESTDGLTWDQRTSESRYLGVSALAAHRTGVITGHVSGLVAFTSDAGATWRDLGALSDSARVNAVAVRGDTVWVGSEKGLWRSLDAGAQFERAGTMPVYSIAVSDGAVYLGSYLGRVYRSVDGGTTWTYTTTLASVPLIAVVAVNSRGHVFAGAQPAGIFISTDGGSTWTQRNEGLTIPAVTAIAFDAQDYAYVGTFGAGVFRSVERTAAVDALGLPSTLDLR